MRAKNPPEFTTIDRRPTINDPIGAYKIIINGIFWGTYCVGRNWADQMYVAFCDEDGTILFIERR